MKNIAILVYGSLINKDELIGEGVDISSCTPVVLKGFRREFSQKSQRPIYLGSNKAVLTVIKDKNSFCNTILVPNIKEKDLEVLDYREAGYNRVKVSLDSLNFKYQALNEKIDEVYIYLGKDEFYDTSLVPIPKYLDICLKGASSWDETFYNDFLKTTFTQEKSLKESIE
ncbi:gamma-glutamylcyclotransferase family protein [Poseidonibacter lekithochrous]|uniref:gamma-glutamylcyclotransferase family protein n=1 Tax=Poseidonibacter lekithochrous TaxID=1904463 RepID=UPI0008FCB753|nr:gamma-glutamylcyclotransferase family protein [Poseidonibacter lekithochrous]QKJ23516.1 gamma-glutamylcyclotransferase [Poseidonibacter lekithochrous]